MARVSWLRARISAFRLVSSGHWRKPPMLRSSVRGRGSAAGSRAGPGRGRLGSRGRPGLGLVDSAKMRRPGLGRVQFGQPLVDLREAAGAEVLARLPACRRTPGSRRRPAPRPCRRPPRPAGCAWSGRPWCPRSASRRSVRISSAPRAGSSPDVGSSRKKTPGLVSSSAAMLARLRWPPDSEPTGTSARSVSSRVLSTSVTAAPSARPWWPRAAAARRRSAACGAAAGARWMMSSCGT